MENQTSEQFSQEDALQEPTQQEITTETEGAQEAPEEVDYKTKFSTSTREAQRLAEENKSLQQKLEEVERSQVEAKQREELEYLKQTDPDGYRVASLEKSLQETQRAVLEEKEERQLDRFVKDNPQADRHRESLKKLGRAEPKMDYAKIWERDFMMAYEESAKSKSEKPETGKGSKTGEPTRSLGEDFNSLPLAQREKAFKEMGL